MNRLVLLSILVLLGIASCGSDDNKGEEGTEKLDPGRKVAGCFDCKGDEYCIMIDGDTETNFCAPNECGEDCDCLMDDAAKRHEECSSSCQEGAGSVYCHP